MGGLYFYYYIFSKQPFVNIRFANSCLVLVLIFHFFHDALEAQKLDLEVQFINFFFADCVFDVISKKCLLNQLKKLLLSFKGFYNFGSYIWPADSLHYGLIYGLRAEERHLRKSSVPQEIAEFKYLVLYEYTYTGSELFLRVRNAGGLSWGPVSLCIPGVFLVC